ncbi:MAG: type II toxin-antitoxin system HicA family toxin [Nitrosopumilus sp.]|uniref:type II toxin-antitoxin system HicA family toxin n=1 Tax=Nitrosopumilus sp. TaxID=2024843 RepID=UPI002930156C|nr:type II toxin-antitoxin system HicA family toxin [Nitrosopumilus sp.]
MSLRNHRWRDVYKVLKKHGFDTVRQRGDHIQMAHLDGRFVTLIKKDPIKVGTLKSILIQAEISQKEFLKEV